MPLSQGIPIVPLTRRASSASAAAPPGPGSGGDRDDDFLTCLSIGTPPPPPPPSFSSPSSSSSYERAVPLHKLDKIREKDLKRQIRLRREQELEAHPYDTPSDDASSDDSAFASTKAKASEQQQSTSLRSTVQIFVSCTLPNYCVPWTSGGIHTGSGTGLVIGVGEEKYILTNAHVVVSKKSTLRVQKQGSTSKFKARVKCIGNDCDLALVEVPDEDFWDGMPLLELEGDVPSNFSPVHVVGFPAGGKSICVTKGVVSRIDCMRYTSQGPSPLLSIQIDAAVNPGNSGGPGANIVMTSSRALCKNHN